MTDHEVPDVVAYLSREHKRARLDKNEKRDKYIKLWKRVYLIVRVINGFKYKLDTNYPSFSDSSFGQIQFEPEFGTNGSEHFSFSQFYLDNNDDINNYKDFDPWELLNSMSTNNDT